MIGDRVSDGAGAAVEPSAAFCDQCGRPGAEAGHDRCAVRRAMEPPRFCADCGRRMVVQVDPFGWTARCSRHGERRG